MKQRYYYLDTLKALSIFLVCFYHSGLYSVSFEFNSVYSVISTFLFSINCICVPMFIMVNGALNFNKPLDIKKHYQKLLKFFLIYMIWRALTYMVLAIASNTDLSSIGTFGLFNRFVLLQDFGGNLLVDHFWFIPVYIGLQLLFPFLKIAFDSQYENYHVLFIVFVTILWLVCFAISDYNLIQPLLPTYLRNFYPTAITNYIPFSNLFGSMLLYFILGGYLGQKNIEDKISIPLYLITLFVVMCLNVLVWYFSGRMTGNYSDLVFGRYTSSSTIVICIIIFNLMRRLEYFFEKYSNGFCKIFLMIGKNTLNIYYIHWIFVKVILPFWNFNINFFTAVIVIFIFLVTSALICELLKKIPILKFIFQ